jgi:ABC-2 type transport system permease protein
MFMMILTGFIFPNQNSVKEIPIGVANMSGSKASQEIVKMVKDLETDDVKAFVISNYQNQAAIEQAIKDQEINGGLVIPSNFEDKISNNQEQAQLTIVEDQSNPQISVTVNQVIAELVQGYSQKVEGEKVGKLFVANREVKPTSLATRTQAIINPIVYQIKGIIPGNPDYFEFVAPGIMAMVVMTSVLTGLAGSIAREKEQGSLDGILVSPISRLAIILGKALSQSIRGLIQGAIVLLLAIILFGVTIHGNLLLVALLLLLTIFSFVGLGILVSALADEQETATQLLFMFQFPMLFLSGVFFPILMMPDFMQKIAKVIPLTYAIDALRKVMVLGGGFSSVATEVLILVIFGIVTLSISVPAFKRVITK